MGNDIPLCLVPLFRRGLVRDRPGRRAGSPQRHRGVDGDRDHAQCRQFNLVAFWRYGPERPEAGPLAGVILAIMVLTVAAAEVAVGIGLILLCYRRWHSADVDRYDSMAG